MAFVACTDIEGIQKISMSPPARDDDDNRAVMRRDSSVVEY